MNLLGAAHAAALAAAEVLRQRPQRVEHKGPIDLVTEIDLASERVIREVLGRLTPHIPVQGEEEGGQGDGLRWVVDPLDGTTNFVHNYPIYAVSIGLVDGVRPVLGCIVDPVRERVYLGESGLGAEMRGGGQTVPLCVSQTLDLDQALGVTGFPSDRRANADFYLQFVGRALKASQAVRRSGSAAWDLAILATGASDYFWEFGLKAWDTAAGVAIVEGAGGRVSRLDGSAYVPGAPDILASNGHLHDALILMLES